MNKENTFLLIRGGRIIDPSQGIDHVGDLLIAEGKIVQVGGEIPTVIASEAKQSQAVDATGLVICPGFIAVSYTHLTLPTKRIV